MLPLLKSDIFDIFEGVASGREVADPQWEDEVTLGVVLASKGYPGHYDKGFVIENLDAANARVYHMGTAIKDGQLVTNGGRVLMVVCRGKGLAAARTEVYDEISKIRCGNLFFRKDIAHMAF